MISIIPHPVLGEITVSRTRRARRITLSVRPPGRIRLSMPPRISLKEALRFVDSKQEWVLRALERYGERNPAVVIEMPYSTRSHHLDLDPQDTDRIKITVKDGRIGVRYPLERDFREPELQEAIKRGIEQAWRLEAKEYLPMRVDELARLHSFSHGNVTVRNTVSKWGSCSVRNDISLSLHLMRLPNHLIDYIILHELCHTAHKNHGPKFHELLDSHTAGKHKSLNRELRDYHTRW